MSKPKAETPVVQTVPTNKLSIKETHHCPHLISEGLDAGRVICCWCGTFFPRDPKSGHGDHIVPGAIENTSGTAAQCPARPS